MRVVERVTGITARSVVPGTMSRRLPVMPAQTGAQ